MAGVFYPNIGTLKLAGNLQTFLAASKVALFKSPFVPDVTVTKAALDAEECDFDGYVAGGITIAAWLNELLDPAGGSSIESGTQQFEFVTGGGPVVTNIVGGWYLCSAGGDLIAVGIFPQPVPMETDGQGIPLNIKLIQGTGQGV